MDGGIEISAVITTYNRAEMLPGALECVLQQQCPGVRYEVIVVDNNSTDRTREVVEKYVAQTNSTLTYLLEPRQGVSYARNTGLARARAPIVAFADDDVCVANDWIDIIKREFEAHPEVDCIGGRVLPQWKIPPPAWLTRNHWMPLALQDYGDAPLYTNAENPLCLVSANLAFRRAVFEEIGPFAPELQRVGNGIGSMEDAELLERYFRTGRQALYVPELLAVTEVPFERMTKAYHRRWHTGHGHFLAIMRSEELERSSGRLFDVPAHLYRQVISDAAACFKYSLLGNPERAFMYENRVRFFLGFFPKRRQDYLAASQRRTLTG
jgi:glycosyltransferase involved in cell wall biosynthesis